MGREIIILMASVRGKCFHIAGLDRNSNQWVRVQSRYSRHHGAIPFEQLVYHDFTPLRLFDVAKINFNRQDNCFEQPERFFYDASYRWKRIDRANLLDVVNLHGFDKCNPIFYNRRRYVSSEELNAVDHRQSLLLLCVNDLRVKSREHYGKKQLTLNFNHEGVDYSSFSIGDLRVRNYFMGQPLGTHLFAHEAAVVFSLSEKFTDNKCYKSAAQILRWR